MSLVQVLLVIEGIAAALTALFGMVLVRYSKRWQ